MLFGQDQNSSLGNNGMLVPQPASGGFGAMSGQPNFGGGVTMPPGQQPMGLAPMSFPKQQAMPSGGTPMGGMNNMVAALMKKPSFMGGGSPTGTGDMPAPTQVSQPANTGDMPPPIPVQPMAQDPSQSPMPQGLTAVMPPNGQSTAWTGSQDGSDPMAGQTAVMPPGMQGAFMSPDNVSQALMPPVTSAFGAFA